MLKAFNFPLKDNNSRNENGHMHGALKSAATIDSNINGNGNGSSSNKQRRFKPTCFQNSDTFNAVEKLQCNNIRMLAAQLIIINSVRNGDEVLDCKGINFAFNISRSPAHEIRSKYELTHTALS